MKIAFEGIDGSGKSTLIDMVYWILLKGRIPVLKIKEPFDDELVNKYINDDPYSQTLLFTLDRLLHAKDDYSAFDIVLSDRSIISSYVYQGTSEDYGVNQVLNYSIGKIPRIDLVVIVDVPVEVAVNRRKNALEGDKKEEILSSIPERYSPKWMRWEERRLAYLKFDYEKVSYYGKTIIINGNQPIEDMLKETFEKMIEVLSLDVHNLEIVDKIKNAYEEDQKANHYELSEPCPNCS